MRFSPSVSAVLPTTRSPWKKRKQLRKNFSSIFDHGYTLPLIEEETDGCIFQFGPNRLWIDKVPNLSHPDIWLEIETNDTDAASSFLNVHGVARRDEVENLREDFNGFIVSQPAILRSISKTQNGFRSGEC